MVDKLVLIKACFEPLSYYFFLKQHPIVNKKSKFSTSPHASDAQESAQYGIQYFAKCIKDYLFSLVIGSIHSPTEW